MTATIGTQVDNGFAGRTRNGEQIRITKSIYIETDNLADATDEIEIDLAHYGLSTLLGAIGFKHTTDNSIVVTENPETAVVGTVVTITIPSGTNDDKRIYLLYGK